MSDTKMITQEELLALDVPALKALYYDAMKDKMAIDTASQNLQNTLNFIDSVIARKSAQALEGADAKVKQ